MGPRVGLATVVKRKNPNPCQKSNHGCLAQSTTTILTELPQDYQPVHFDNTRTLTLYIINTTSISQSPKMITDNVCHSDSIVSFLYIAVFQLSGA